MKKPNQEPPPVSWNGDDGEQPEDKALAEFYADPKVAEHYGLLKEIGVFRRIDGLKKEIRDNRDLISAGLDIMNRTSLEDIMDTTVVRISDRFRPSFIAFLWKPILTRDEITIRAYRNHRPADLGIRMYSIAPFESFFRGHPGPVSYPRLAAELADPGVSRTLEKLRPEIIIPMAGGFGLYGIILMGPATGGEHFSGGELTFIEQLMAFVTQGITNYLNYQHSLRDVKTGLYNHGFFVHRLGEEIARTRRGAYASSVIVMDVDEFKKVNDAFGHMAGDKVLENLAITIKQMVRLEDVPSRFGGEEFTVLLPESGADGAWLVSERLRNTVAAMRVPWDPPLPPVTISLGICGFDHRERLSADNIIQRADAALYVSKQRGRNRSTIWKPEMGHVEG
jgi:diguanylate cyclase (GGDEF)-like protein